MNRSIRKYVKAILNLLVAVVLLALVIWLVPKGIAFFLPFVIGWLIACMASPLVKFLEEKLKIRRKASSAFVVIVVIGLVILCIYLVGSKLIREMVGFVEDLPVMWAGMKQDLDEVGENLSVVIEKLPKDVQSTIDSITSKASELMMDLVSQISTPTIEAVGNIAKQLPTVIIGVIMCLLSAYFFVAERGSWAEHIRKAMPESILFRAQLVKNSIVKAVGGYFKAQIKIEIWIYLLLVVGLMILQVDYVLLVALGIAILDFLPFFGTGTIMVPWAILKFLSADYKMTIGLLVIWGVGQLVRQVIQPKILGDSMEVPPLPTLFLLYIGYKLGGVLGMILAVPIGLVVASLYREGAFDTTKKSIQILIAGLNNFRRLNDQDLAVISSYERECSRSMEEQKQQQESWRGDGQQEKGRRERE